jgi:hypothetical protein
LGLKLPTFNLLAFYSNSGPRDDRNLGTSHFDGWPFVEVPCPLNGNGFTLSAKIQIADVGLTKLLNIKLFICGFHVLVFRDGISYVNFILFVDCGRFDHKSSFPKPWALTKLK